MIHTGLAPHLEAAIYESTGCPKKPLTVNPGDQEKLELLARRPKTAQRVAIRSKIVLWAAEGLTDQEIAKNLG
jgi:hypothetical protein